MEWGEKNEGEGDRGGGWREDGGKKKKRDVPNIPARASGAVRSLWKNRVGEWMSLLLAAIGAVSEHFNRRFLLLFGH